MPSDRRRRAGPSPTGFSTTGGRTALGYWVPLAVTVTVATVGLVAWVWSEVSDTAAGDEADHGEYEDVNSSSSGSSGSSDGGGRRNRRRRRGDQPIGLDPVSEGSVRAAGAEQEDPGVVARMQGALRRTPSPQQVWDDTSRRVVAGVSAAGSAVGGALTSIREEGSGNGDFEEHSRWAQSPSGSAAPVSEGRGGSRSRSGPDQFTMSGALAPGKPSPSSSKRKRHTAAIVVSSVAAPGEPGGIEGHMLEHTSILSLLPEHVEPETAKVFVLIHAPGMQTPTPGGDHSPSRPTLSVTSSYDNIGRDEATAAESPELVSSQEGFESATPQFKVLYDQARVLVDKETMIMPFNTPNGHIPILRHLSPDVVYVQESLAGDDGDAVQKLSGWVRQVVVIADESAASADEERWWHNENVGRGKQIEVIDLAQVGEDWHRRIGGHY